MILMLLGLRFFILIKSSKKYDFLESISLTFSFEHKINKFNAKESIHYQVKDLFLKIFVMMLFSWFLLECVPVDSY